LGQDEALANKVKVVINRIGMDSDITLKKAEETIGKPIYWQLPNDPKVLAESRGAGGPLIQHAPKSKAHQAIARLAHALPGKQGDAAPKKEKRGFFSFK